MKTIVIAGLGSAGYAAISTLKRIGFRDEIIVIDPKPFDLLHPCGLPYVLDGEASYEAISQNIAFSQMGIKKITGSLQKINTSDHSLLIQTPDGQNSMHYGSLLLCMGSSPIRPPIRGLDTLYTKGIYSLTTADDLQMIQNKIPESSNGFVVGAGAIGLESAFSISKNSIPVTVVEMKDQVLPGVLDPDMALAVQEYLESLGIKILLSQSVEAFEGKSSIEKITVSGNSFAADLIILATGFSPNTSAVKESGIACDRLGIIVDNRLSTNSTDVYAAGDCSVSYSIIDSKPIGAKLATSAYHQGTIAAKIMSGIDTSYKGSSGAFVTKIGALEVAGCGFTTAQAKERGFDPCISKIKSSIRPDYMNNNCELLIKIIADKGTGKILGGQAISKEGAASRINILSTAIEFGLTLHDLERIELAYCPAVSEVYDPLSRAVDGALRRINK